VKLNNGISLQVDIFEEDGQVKVFIAKENSTGSTTSNVETIEDISKALENYLSDIFSKALENYLSDIL
jgi:hypothetical protein